jgi:ABC-type multidrug transport system fused ATPase/permease subunit
MKELISSVYEDESRKYDQALKSTRMHSLVMVFPGVFLGIIGYMVSVSGILLAKVTLAMTVALIATIVQSFVSMRLTVDGLVQNMSFLGERAYFFKNLNQFLLQSEEWPDEETEEAERANGKKKNNGIVRAYPASPVEKNMHDYRCPYEIELSHVWFRYPGTTCDVLQDVNLRISPGQTVVICGRNGAGKSTLMRLIAGLYVPTRGKVLINGETIKKDNIDAIHQHMSALFQDYSVFAFDLRTNIALSRIVDDDMVSQTLDFAFSTDSHPALDAHLVKEFGGEELSGGQKQRVGLARLAYKDADCLLLDEPTSAIDPLREAELFDSIREVCRGKTAVIVTHRLPLAAIGSCVIVVDDGKIIEKGTVEQLKNVPNGLFATMLSEQARIAV